ncbi:DUF5059 domain-containing protein [Natrinema thermotolerans]|uniref:DUF5059 domain-containing protein n=1 Tax=Natrinema thermotolerans TaxID=121872 RepID=A0AAF0T1M8_9EURY|nr:DUF5059 domain-containing protein [Natrinema thermotolerans]QCC60650.1 DUF5059 domain-containing protein [Natrinema thermotolerans]QCC61536.1 DUF5059 domain-containing protein [Natrinema thermotolerans]WMT07693.1 DUF5059 domain-containing protein [Natrinema thermotolerans]WMT08325.1 DUF5059 domain-containing protein [Natrinema thermotolerans]
MRQTRRTWLKGSGAALVTLGLAGCSGDGDGDDGSTDDEGPSSDEESVTVEPAERAVAAEWNAMRARLWDALAAGEAGKSGTGAAIAGDTFERFETASGEYNAHELLEETDHDRYEAFEEALGELRTEGLDRGDIGRAREETVIGSDELGQAQTALVGEETAQALDLQSIGTSTADAVVAAEAGAFDAAETVATDALERFEEAAVHDAIEEADSEIYERFESALEAVAAAAGEEDLEGVRSSATDTLAAANEGAYALAPSESAAGAGQIATYQARGWDAAALSGLGGPSTAFAHAAALTGYRARAHDAVWLFERGHGDAAGRVVENAFAHFEGARAHEALEEASEDAYHRFEEDGLDALATAIENDDPEGVESAVTAVDEGLVTGIEALGTGVEPALLEASFFRARLGDAVERYRLGESEVAAEIASGLFETFEANEADFHETLEETDHDLYETFEDEHLNGLIDAFENEDDAAVADHADGLAATLLEFETTAGTTAQVSAVESAAMAARAFDAGALDVLGAADRAETVLQEIFEDFERGAGGFHEALEEADHDRYESFEAALGDARNAAAEGGDVSAAARAFNEQAIEATYTVVADAGGSFGDAAASLASDVFAAFEEARAHELLEEADRDIYEGFEAALEDYIGALEDGSDVEAAAETFATAALRAQFAVAGAPDAAPSGDGTGDSGEGSGSETDLGGGPNVVEGVPDDADHVVDMQAVAFEPETLTVAQGDTVAWKHAAGEPHSVTAYEDRIPDDADYWASGGFDGEDAAREGWENGKGAVQSGESYVHTFETTGEHEYVCVPHEKAGMVGTVVVE